MKILSVRDSRGRESTTLLFTVIGFVAVTYVFILKGTAADMLNYGLAVASIMAPWLHREWTEKTKKEKADATD